MSCLFPVSIRKIIRRSARCGVLLLQRLSVVGRFDTITLADFRKPSPGFKNTIVRALQFLKDNDARRYHRLAANVRWIVNCTLAYPGAQYDHDLRTCRVDMRPDETGPCPYVTVAWWARTLVHEGTHAYLLARDIRYTADLRERIELCCIAEENRFVDRLGQVDASLADALRHEISLELWRPIWAATKTEEILRMRQRLASYRHGPPTRDEPDSQNIAADDATPPPT
jgi:hypothetical protein